LQSSKQKAAAICVRQRLQLRENASPSLKQQHGNTIKISGGKAGEPNQGVTHK
jgi:hypothetical protein